MMQEEHQKVVDLLQRQLVSANAALVQRPHTPIKSPTHDTDDTDGQRDPRHEERQAAEVGGSRGSGGWRSGDRVYEGAGGRMAGGAAGIGLMRVHRVG